MKILPKDLRNKIPPLGTYKKSKPEDVPISAKFFCPWCDWAWYAIEGEEKGGDFLFFGLVDGAHKELGRFLLSGLEIPEGPYGLRIERDRDFEGVLKDVL